MAKETEKESVFKVVDVVTQTEPMIQTPEGTTISVIEAMAQMLNDLKEIKKNI